MVLGSNSSSSSSPKNVFCTRLADIWARCWSSRGLPPPWAHRLRQDRDLQESRYVAFLCQILEILRPDMPTEITFDHGRSRVVVCSIAARTKDSDASFCERLGCNRRPATISNARTAGATQLTGDRDFSALKASASLTHSKPSRRTGFDSAAAGRPRQP